MLFIFVTCCGASALFIYKLNALDAELKEQAEEDINSEGNTEAKLDRNNNVKPGISLRSGQNNISNVGIQCSVSCFKDVPGGMSDFLP